MRLRLCCTLFISGYCLRGTAACCLLLPANSCGNPCMHYNVFEFLCVLFLAAMRVLSRQAECFGALGSSLIKSIKKLHRPRDTVYGEVH